MNSFWQMKRLIFVLVIFCSLFLIMVIVNESFRQKTYYKSFKKIQIQTINPSRVIIDNCSWACHDSNNYCKDHHIKYNSIKRIDFLYNGIIRFLKSGLSNVEGFNYALNNIIFLVVLWPLWMIYLFMRVIFNNKNKNK